MADETIIEGMVSPDPGSIETLTKHSMSGLWLHRFTFVRWAIAAAIFFGSLFVRCVLGVAELDTTVLIPVALGIAAYNTVIWFLVRNYRDTYRSAAALRYLHAVQYVSIVLDYLALTVTIWVMGGSRSLFLPFYLFHVMLSCILLSRTGAWISTGLAFLFLVVLVIGEWMGFITTQAGFGALVTPNHLTGEYVVLLLVVYGVLFGLTATLLIRLAAALQEGEIELRIARAELERLSSMRKDFLHIALHNLQSPLGVLSMFLDNLRSGRLGQLPPGVMDVVARGRERLQGMNEFLQDLQVLSQLESGEIGTQAEAVDLAAVVRELADEYRDEVEEKDHTLTVRIDEGIPPVSGIGRLLREAVRNYLTNAIKYTPAGGTITLRVRQKRKNVIIEVTDNGIGIAPGDQHKLFGEFVRIRGDTPEQRKIKGTGLGLSIVRRVAELYGGAVGVRSRPGEGSTFYIILPIPE